MNAKVHATTLEENWGKPRIRNADRENVLVYGIQYGIVSIEGGQRTFGYEGAPIWLLCSKSARPHHVFAYYTFVKNIFKADVLFHFGKPS